MSKKEQRKEQILQSALGLFAKQGFYATTIPDIAADMGMSVGNLYNYFKSKDLLAQEIIKHISHYLGQKLRAVNEQPITTHEKIEAIVRLYFETAAQNPEMLDYFLRIYLSTREVFKEGCEGMICVSEFVTEIMIFFEEGVRKGDLREQDFFSAFGLFMGYLGGMVFLKGEALLNAPLEQYIDDVATNIYKALSA